MSMQDNSTQNENKVLVFGTWFDLFTNEPKIAGYRKKVKDLTDYEKLNFKVYMSKKLA